MENKLVAMMEAAIFEREARKAEPEDTELMKQAVKRLRDLDKYEKNDRKLQAVYGEHEGMLDIVVRRLVEAEATPGLLPAVKSRLLTDEHVDMWEKYKALGTPEEIETKLKKKKSKEDLGKMIKS